MKRSANALKQRRGPFGAVKVDTLSTSGAVGPVPRSGMMPTGRPRRPCAAHLFKYTTTGGVSAGRQETNRHGLE